MHNAARATLAIGGLLTIVGIIVVTLGVGTAATAFDIEDNAEMIGSSGTFTANEEHWGFEIFVKGEISASSCESISVTITDSSGNEEGEFWGTYYDEDCYSSDHDYDGYTYIGFFSGLHDNGLYSVDASQQVIVVDTADAVGAQLGGAGLAAFCGMPALGCGVLFLLLGGVLGLALKDKQNIQVTHSPGAPVNLGQNQQPPV